MNTINFKNEKKITNKNVVFSVKIPENNTVIQYDEHHASIAKNIAYTIFYNQKTNDNHVIYDISFPFNEFLTLKENLRLLILAKGFRLNNVDSIILKISNYFNFKWNEKLSETEKNSKLLFKQLCFFSLPLSKLIIFDKAIYGEGEYRKIAHSAYTDLGKEKKIILFSSKATIVEFENQVLTMTLDDKLVTIG